MHLAADTSSLRGLFGLLVLFVCLSTGYNLIQPIFEPPDEIAHFRFAQWLAQEKRLPEVYADAGSARHEVAQPPLYYVLIAPIIGAVDTSDWLTVPTANPHYREQANSVNVYVHGNSAETFPYSGTPLAVHLARAVNTLVGCLTIISCFGLAKLILPKRALLVAGLVALTPQFISANSTLTNDALVTAFCAAGLWVLVALMRRKSAGLFYAIAIGLLWGAAALSKMSGLAFGGVIMLGLALTVLRTGQWRIFVTRLVVVSGSALSVAGWWFWRNWQLYDDLLAWDELLYANRTLVREASISLVEMLPQMRQVFFSFWASFGNRLPLPRLFDFFILVLVSLALVGLLLLVVHWGRAPGWSMHENENVVLLVWIAGSMLSFLRWMSLIEETAQGRLLLPIFPAVAVLLSIGLARIDARGWVQVVLVAGLGVWAVVLPLVVVAPAYALPDVVSAEIITTPSNRIYGEQMKLHGYDMITPGLHRGERLSIDLFWEALEEIDASYLISIHAVDADEQVVASYDGVPFRGLYPTQNWHVGHLFRDRYELSPLPDRTAAGIAYLYVNVRPFSTNGSVDGPLPIVIDDVALDGAWRLTTFKVAVPEPGSEKPRNRVDFTFGGFAQLVDYCFSEVPVVGEPLDITLIWVARDSAEIEYTIFVHLVDERGQQLLAQGDSPPMGNRYPTTIWAEGETIVDTHSMYWHGMTGLPTRFNLGLYDPVSGQRVPVVGADGEQIGNDAVDLGLPSLDPLQTIALCSEG